MVKVDIIENFIKKRFSNDCHWLDGNCLWFSIILCYRFDFLDIYYLPIEGHFIAGNDTVYYDWTGQITPQEKPIKFKDIQQNDPIWYDRLLRDCYY